MHMKTINRLIRRAGQEAETKDCTPAISEWPRHRIRNLFFYPALVLALLCLCGCLSVTYDVRRLDQPVILNNNPCLLQPGADTVKLTDVDHYSAKVSRTVAAASSQSVSHGPVY